MKKLICILSAVILVLCSLFFTGCDDGKKNNISSESAAQSEQTATETAGKDSEIQKYLDSFLEGDNDFYGAWQLKGFGYMSILFRNDKLAEMVTGTEGYFSKYGIDKKAGTLTVQLLPNVIDGAYKYKFSKDKQKLTLTLNGNKLVLVKQKDFSLMPKAPKNPVTDSDLIGWWENESGMFYCFQKDGIMYENSISMETCYTYTVKNGQIKATYNSGGKMTDNFTYSFKNGKLKINGEKCTRKDSFE